MGVMSRRVVPVCGNLCVFCPSLRARSRQPVKRYKKLMSDIFPRNQVAEPNDRKIGKLCEYASRNPLRIPKITESLEQRCYKDLRNENFGSVKVVLCVYRKLLSTCKEQMSLFANSLLGILQTLLEQTRSQEMQILGCKTLVEFTDCQTNGTYMFNLEGFIPNLCQLAQEVGDNEQALLLRSAGLQALSYMVKFMGDHSHLCMDFDKIISVILENFTDLQSKSNLAKLEKLNSQSQSQLVQGYSKGGDLHSLSEIKEKNGVTGTETESKLDTAKDPAYWSKICLYNMAKLAKEATTVRRVLEPFFHNFDAENHWSPEKGVASCILLYLQSLLAESGDNSHLLLSILVKHLDHKNVAKQPILQIDIIKTTTQLAQNVKQQASVAIIGAISDLIKHLRKCLQNLAETSSIGDGTYRLNTELKSALEMCILQLSKKVGDIGPILDLMAVALENIPVTTITARSIISAIYQTAKLITSVPNVSYHNKAFPDALFHQLLLAMAHPDYETQIGAHSIFSMVLMPSMVSPWLDHKTKIAHKAQNDSFSTAHETFSGDENFNGKLEEGKTISGVNGKKYAIHPYRGYSFSPKLTDGNEDQSSLRLSSHQVSLLLSSIWVQATSVGNGPANYEAMAHTYSIALLFSRSKVSNHMGLVRCFQLAFSLRRISLDQEGGLQPSRRRSLFTLASYMLIFSARACSLPDLIPIVKASLTEAAVDPFLELVDDIRLLAVCKESENIIYGSQEDEVAALKSLLAVELDDKQLKETVISYFMTKFSILSEDELSSIKNQLLQSFSSDDAYPLGPLSFMETSRPCSPLALVEFPSFDEIMIPGDLMGEETGPEHSGSQSDHKTSLSTNYPDVLNVNQLLDSVLETSRQVASFSTSSSPLPYDQMKDQCEALVAGKQQKMSVIQSLKHRQENNAIILSSGNEVTVAPLHAKALEYSPSDLKLVTQQSYQALDHSPDYGLQHSLRLPPSSPYDKFLRAAGC
ncbi:hypothetical protein PHAVU_005G152600 [Phaseolus vulgaris]|uniref:Uncharacterized protein n=2 Tax=Phaseolus vulgaris TaxID=3885 RepID=V7C0J2_PHAVU|nr:hypothetical protein PHAVU_005G152600g [Phaseolus vulgaris]XP_007150427.1 hypothetical protein PHAVU_005G152600g [Phaseolus vulgaris]ESW22420.1 hypothetical protein PHAVU_005G152600g [Phaseolus vulgaris]ESW22421.1 hypothetical protein PHAVU_005G152600g [Phaseolus vulgaris]